MTTGVKAKIEALQALQISLMKSDSEMSALIGCTRATWRRAMDGENVSASFMARISVIFDAPFDQYFRIA